MRAIPVLFLTLTLFAAVAEGDLGEPISLHEVAGGSLLFRTVQNGAFLPAPVLETEVALRVTGLVARAQVRQRFQNPTDRWLEGVYAFPLPETAAVDGLQMVIGDRVVEGEIHERQAAKKVYEAAKREGKKASLVEQERPNIFTTSVANIGPGETIDVVIEYQQEVGYDLGRFHLRFPMVIGKRYVPGAGLPGADLPGSVHAEDPVATPAEDGDGSPAGGTVVPASFGGLGWAAATDQVPDAARITPPVAAGAQNPVYLQVDLDPGLPLARIASPSHALDVEAREDGRHRVELRDLVVAADRDFVLEWEPEPGTAPRAALFTEELDGAAYQLLMVLPPHGAEARAARLPRETIFVIDTSGSMKGASIRQARQALLAALDRLAPEDHFNVVRFSSDAERLFPESVPADELHRERAAHYVDRLAANGGTEMLSALELALGDQDERRGVRQVIFITDGSVGNEDALFTYIHRHLGPSRLFPVGIGSAPNSHFMRRAASFGRGTFTYVGSVGEVAERMGELFAKIESPVLHGVEVSWDGAAEVWPERIPDLYLGEPVMIVAKLPAVASVGEVRLSGWRGTEPWDARFQLAGGDRETGLGKLWARKKIAALLDGATAGADLEGVRRQVVELALGHHLVSKYTSLVAVDRIPTAPPGTVPESRPLPVDLPAGWSAEHATVGLPQSATPAELHLLLGLAALAAAALLVAGVRP